MAFEVRDLGRCPYALALALQEEVVEWKLAGDARDYLLLVEHEPVYTLGRGADVGDLLGADERLCIPSLRVGRGGGATFHGPGQLVAYPIVSLRGNDRDLHAFVRRLEEVLINVCAQFGIAARRQGGLTGVWVSAAKIASIGIGVRRWTTLHGVALNVSTDLSFFRHIVPCRMAGVRMTSMEAELGSAPAMAAVRTALVQQFQAAFSGRRLPVDEAHA